MASAEVTSANHVASLCAFHVCGLCAADRFNGDPETEKGAPSSNQVSDVVPSPHLQEDALANVGGLHRRRARTHLRRFLLGATPLATQRDTALPQTQEWWQRRPTHVPRVSHGRTAPACHPSRIFVASPDFFRVLRTDACSVSSGRFLSLHFPAPSRGWFLP